MSFFEINSSWDSDGDNFAAAEDEFGDSHPLSGDDDDSDDERPSTFEELMARRRQKSKTRGHESAPDIGVHENFGLRELPQERKRENELDIKPGDIFFDREYEESVLVVKNYTEGEKNFIDVFYAEGTHIIRDTQLVKAEPFRIQNAGYVKSFKRPLTLETLLFFVYEYSNKKTWSMDKKNAFKKALNSDGVRNNFQKLLQKHVDTSPDPRDAVRSVFPGNPGTVSSVIGRFEKRF